MPFFHVLRHFCIRQPLVERGHGRQLKSVTPIFENVGRSLAHRFVQAFPDEYSFAPFFVFFSAGHLRLDLSYCERSTSSGDFYFSQHYF